MRFVTPDYLGVAFLGPGHVFFSDRLVLGSRIVDDRWSREKHLFAGSGGLRGSRSIVMIRWLIALTWCALFTAGCGDRHRPVVRRGMTGPDAQGESRVEGARSVGGPTDRQHPVDLASPEVDLGPMRLLAPDGWVWKRAAISFILAEFSLPRAEGDTADARLTVSTAGGSMEENVDRWRRQFGKEPEEQSEQQVELGGLQVTLADFSGTYLDSRTMVSPAVERADYRMLGAIIPIEGQLCFVKCYGPKKTMAKHVDEFQAFVRSLSSRGSAR